MKLGKRREVRQALVSKAFFGAVSHVLLLFNSYKFIRAMIFNAIINDISELIQCRARLWYSNKSSPQGTSRPGEMYPSYSNIQM